jgi:hypothetical protein
MSTEYLQVTRREDKAGSNRGSTVASFSLELFFRQLQRTLRTRRVQFVVEFS